MPVTKRDRGVAVTARLCQWYTCVVDGEALSLGYYVASICEFVVRQTSLEGHAGCLDSVTACHLEWSRPSRSSRYRDCCTRLGGSESEHSDRMCQIVLILTSSQLDTISRAMQETFPELKLLDLSTNYKTVPVVPDSFLGVSTPCLEFLGLRGMSFPGSQKLLLSAKHTRISFTRSSRGVRLPQMKGRRVPLSFSHLAGGDTSHLSSKPSDDCL